MKGSDRDYKSQTILKMIIQFYKCLYSSKNVYTILKMLMQFICHALVNALYYQDCWVFQLSNGEIRIWEQSLDFQRGGYVGKFEINKLWYNSHKYKVWISDKMVQHRKPGLKSKLSFKKENPEPNLHLEYQDPTIAL